MKKPDPTYPLFIEEMVQAYQEVHGTKYLFNAGKDGMALKRLLSIANREEILAVWMRGLTTEKEFDRVHNFAELAGKWSRLVAKPAPNPNVYTETRAPRDSEDPTNAPFGACCVCGKGAWAMLHVRDYPLPFCPSQDEAHLTKQEAL